MSAPPTFAIAFDTREQLPWSFSDEIRVTRATLAAGDYAPVGAETRCAIERKSLADFIGSITHERERFKRELAKLAAYEFAAVLIEANVADVEERRYRAQVHPNSVLGSAVAITTDFVPVIWAGDRANAAALCARFLRCFWTTHVLSTTEAA